MLSLGYHRPAPALQRYVQFYAQRELIFRDPVFVHSVPARAAPMLEFTFGDRFKVLYSGSHMEEISPRAVIVGMLTRPHAQLRLQGSFQPFVIMFQPAGLQTLFAVPLNELTGRSYDAYAVLGKTIAELDVRLGQCVSFQSRVQTADEFLARRVPATPGRNSLTAAVRLIGCNKGRLRIPDLALTVTSVSVNWNATLPLRLACRPNCLHGSSDFKRLSIAKLDQPGPGPMSRTSSDIMTRCT